MSYSDGFSISDVIKINTNATEGVLDSSFNTSTIQVFVSMVVMLFRVKPVMFATVTLEALTLIKLTVSKSPEASLTACVAESKMKPVASYSDPLAIIAEIVIVLTLSGPSEESSGPVNITGWFKSS